MATFGKKASFPTKKSCKILSNTPGGMQLGLTLSQESTLAISMMSTVNIVPKFWYWGPDFGLSAKNAAPESGGRTFSRSKIQTKGSNRLKNSLKWSQGSTPDDS